jgi:hypothetical protein
VRGGAPPHGRRVERAAHLRAGRVGAARGRWYPRALIALETTPMRLLAAASLALFLPLAAVAKPWTPPPASGGTGGRLPPSFDEPGGRGFRASEPALQFVVQGGFDFGSKKLIEVTLSDGTTPSIKANQGLNFAVGAAFLKLAGGLLATQATIGIEGWDINASNGGATWMAFPLEVVEMLYLDPIRVGAGASYLLSPSLKGDGVLSFIDVDFENSLGFVFQADWVSRLPRSGRGGRITLGPRFVVQKLKPKLPGAESIDANSFGVFLGYTG